MLEAKALRSRELLVLLIEQVSPRTDAPELADRLLRRYGSLAPLMCSNPQDLLEMPGMTPTLASAIVLIPQLTRYARRETPPRTSARNVRQAGEYLARLYIGQHDEHVYLMCLTKEGRVIDCPLIQRGTLDQAPFYYRDILEAAFRARAHAVVLSHNHPSGTVLPSASDVMATEKALETLSSLGFLLLDHVIIADGKAISIRALGLVSDEKFRAQAREDPLLQNWLYEQQGRFENTGKKTREPG